MFDISVTTRLGLWAAVLATTIGVLVVAIVLCKVIVPDDRLVAAIRTTLIITPITAVPFAYFVWSKVSENILLNEKLQRLIDRDLLTNVSTREYFFNRMSDAPDVFGASLMVDIDHFKIVNDRYGHLVGDQVIQHVATLLQNSVRDQDIVARFGGEEFVVFLYGREGGAALGVAERMRQSIADCPINCDDQTIKVTVSIGVSIKEHSENVEDAIRDADAALYRAKNAGRNRTFFEEDASPVAVGSTLSAVQG